MTKPRYRLTTYGAVKPGSVITTVRSFRCYKVMENPEWSKYTKISAGSFGIYPKRKSERCWAKVEDLLNG